MGSVKLAVGCFTGCFAAVVGFGMTHDWLKCKTHKPKSGVEDTPESGQVPLGDEEQES